MRVLLLLALLASACDRDVSPAPTATPEPAPGTTQPCRSAEQVARTIDRFVAAFNSGDPAAVRAAVSRYAEWISLSTRGLQDGVYGQDDIVVHLLRRQRAGDRLAAPMVRVNELVKWDGSAHFEVEALRLTRGGQGVELRGKGVLQCDGRGVGVILLSLAAD
jgi:hypothetical protein